MPAKVYVHVSLILVPVLMNFRSKTKRSMLDKISIQFGGIGKSSLKFWSSDH